MTKPLPLQPHGHSPGGGGGGNQGGGREPRQGSSQQKAAPASWDQLRPPEAPQAPQVPQRPQQHPQAVDRQGVRAPTGPAATPRGPATQAAMPEVSAGGTGALPLPGERKG